MVPHLPQGETASALAFNQVLRFLGFTIGSAASPALLAAFGGGASGFRSTLLVICGLWVAAGIAVVVLDARRANAAPQVAPGRSDLMRRRRSPRE
ncbi:hypothetical protein, partial [Nocardioides stalactiti]|uniref:hypothetical protein n=1 Tax=Nocardioides stalactiti TaxID=2755356 RepID=UPI001C7EA220